MMPGLVGVGDVEHGAPSSASRLMPLIWMKRGLPSEKTVPATERVMLLGGHRQPDVAVDRRPACRAVTSDIMMPRSLAMIGAETMLTSATCGCSRPASSARGQRLGVQLGDDRRRSRSRSP